MDSVRIHVWITGHVQGVGFRYHTRRQAQTRLITGWVQNLSDGRVEAVFEGTEQAVAEMIHWCERGPSGASVTHLETRIEPYQSEFSSFTIRV